MAFRLFKIKIVTKEKYKNNEQLSKEEVEIIDEYFRTNNYFKKRNFFYFNENFDSSCSRQLYYRYSAKFDEKELIEMRKISKKRLNTKNKIYIKKIYGKNIIRNWY